MKTPSKVLLCARAHAHTSMACSVLEHVCVSACAPPDMGGVRACGMSERAGSSGSNSPNTQRGRTLTEFAAIG